MTLRDEVRELRQKYWLSGLQSSADDLTDILSRHHEEPAAPSGDLTDLELVEKIEKWIGKLCKTGGRAWCLSIPPDANNDPDLLIAELCNRFERSIGHTEEPTTPSQRERIATAVFVSILSEKDKAIHIPTAASSSVYSADALIAELNKPTK